jgi:hypothetical protein
MAECSPEKENMESIMHCGICQKPLQQPIRLQCLHCYCKGCLDRTVKVEKGGEKGWNCQTCGSFTNENMMKEDTLVEKLIAMEINKQTNQQCAPICDFCEDETCNLMYCRDCKMVICGKCKRIHIKTPSNKHHIIEEIGKESGMGVKESIIDGVFYCSKHETYMVEIFCKTCQEILCKQCLNNHKSHVTSTTEENLGKLVVDMDEYMKNIASKLCTD